MKHTQEVNLNRVLPHKLEMTWLRVAWSAERAVNMSQSNDSLAHCADKGRHSEATISLRDALRSGARG